MQIVRVKPIEQLGADERGATYGFSTKKTGDFMLIQRVAGSMSGNSYHEGKNAGTNPKTFILLSGTAQFLYREVGLESVEKLVITQPSIIEIQPRVIHAVRAITDIMMLEANSIQDIREDRVKEDVLLVATD